MPCNSDYMNATGKEIQLSRVACLLDELAGKKEIDRSHWAGYHPRVYNGHADGDALVLELCSKLQDVDVRKYSLEMQMWWRDHQAADKDRLEKSLAKAKEMRDREAAIQKLTPYERKILGIK